MSVAIRVSRVTRDFEIYAKPSDLALEVLTRKKRHRTFRALDDVSFEVEKGQVLGVIGPNGAGKSTLLKIITGVLDPTSGVVEIAGRVTAILELGLGFNAELSGRDNIFLSGLLYGMTREEIETKLEAIIDFSGLRAFIEQPVKTYSSGMHSRLAFSIATAVDPEILIIDEALAAGDAMFVQKCMRRIRQLCAGGRTVLIVSHGTGILAQLCQKVIWMDSGRLKMVGPALQVVQAYDLASHQGADSYSWLETIEDAALGGTTLPLEAPQPLSVEEATTAAFGEVPATSEVTPPTGRETGKMVFRRGPILIDSVTMLDHNGRPSTKLTTVRPFSLRIAYHCDGDLPKETLGIGLAVNRLADLAPVLQWYTQFIRPDETRETYESRSFRARAARRGAIELRFPYAPFRGDDYILSIGLLPNAPGNWEFYEYRHFFYPFQVVDASLSVGAPVFFEPSNVRFEEIAEDVHAAEPARV